MLLKLAHINSIVVVSIIKHIHYNHFQEIDSKRIAFTDFLCSYCVQYIVYSFMTVFFFSSEFVGFSSSNRECKRHS